jgi:hypothetical protein
MALSTPSTITVSTRRGPISFTTQLEWHEAIAELRTIVALNPNNDFASSLLSREDKDQYMSDSQVSWVYKLAQDALDERNMDGKLKALSDASVDASDLLGTLVEANVKGIKKPILRFQMANGAQVRIKYMTRGGNAGGAWVTVNDELRGKIDDQGVFVTYNCRYQDQQWVEEFSTFIEQISADVNGALTAYGKLTSQCGCCGLPLTNKESIERGIGPICLDKYGLLALA